MKKPTIFRIGATIVLLAIILYFTIYHRDQVNLQSIQTMINNAGIWAPVLFVFIYVIATVAFLPGLVVTLAGGLLFGAFWGVVYNITGAVIGATLAFLIARYLLSDWVAKKTAGRLKKLIEGVNNEGWRFVAIVRLVPLFPFNLLNYALGLTRIRWLDYVLASTVFMLPGTIAYTYLGSLGEAVMNEGGLQLASKIAIGVGLLVLVSIIPYVVKKYWKKSL